VKIRHITKTRDFARILEDGKRIKGRALCLYFLEEEGAEGLSIGTVIPKKLAPSAVQRNYIRRLIYAVCREKAKGGREGAKIAIRLTQNIRGKKRKDLSKELRGDLEALLARTEV
jgi:ribonuclease P protein component